MATRGLSYDHPNMTVRREHGFVTTAGNATVSGHFMHFQKARAVAAHVQVHTAGTTAGATLTFKLGTTSIGAVTLTTNTAGYTTSVVFDNKTAASMDYFTVTNGTDATCRAYVTYEYQVLPDAVHTVPDDA